MAKTIEKMNIIVLTKLHTMTDDELNDEYENITK
jgi:hypothetical protein